MDDKDKRIAELVAENARLKIDLLCDVCLGKSLLGDGECACRGTGSALEVRNYARTELVREQLRREAMERELAEERARLDWLIKFYGDQDDSYTFDPVRARAAIDEERRAG